MIDENVRRRTTGRRVRLVDDAVVVEVADVDTGDGPGALLELGAWLPPQPAIAHAMTAAVPHSWARGTSAQRR
ncbi:MAG: hypothetical protein QOD66_191 [Solirubrobacteraceae bacterium]|nr:hypothetical protein [Solirubrobacteraceae bacterium]